MVSKLAQLLKDSGFSAALRDRNAAFNNAGDAVAARQQERQEALRAAGRRLVLAALLASACFTGHLAHVWPGAPAAMAHSCQGTSSAEHHFRLLLASCFLRLLLQTLAEPPRRATYHRNKEQLHIGPSLW